jgi:energy-coupling factor transport system ATP-binding protein
VKAFVACHMGDWRVTPFITGFASTFVSGGAFTFILKLVLGLPLKVWIFAMLPVVAVVGVLNGLITFGLFRPVKKLFYAQEGGEDK